MSTEMTTAAEFEEPTGTKAALVEAALETLKTKGYAGSSAREIARTGGFNQALIFYHYGSVQNLLLATLDLTSARRMAAYRPAFENATTLPQLAQLAQKIYAEDLEQGYITVLGEMVAAGATNPELGPEVVARMDPWLDMTEQKVAEILRGSPFESMVSARDLAFGFISLYLGLDMMTHLDPDRSRSTALLELGAQLSNLVAAFLPSQQQKE